MRCGHCVRAVTSLSAHTQPARLENSVDKSNAGEVNTHTAGQLSDARCNRIEK